mgnify:CR=1 FL=1
MYDLNARRASNYCRGEVTQKTKMVGDHQIILYEYII